MPPEGLEHSLFPSGIAKVPDSGGNKSGNIQVDSRTPTPSAKPTPPTDPDLSAVVAAWDYLPPAVRAGIVAMIEALGRTVT